MLTLDMYFPIAFSNILTIKEAFSLTSPKQENIPRIKVSCVSTLVSGKNQPGKNPRSPQKTK